MIGFLSLFLSCHLFATIFQLQPIQQQIKEADGVLIGHYLKSKSIQLEDGQVVTQKIFKMNKELGVNSGLLQLEEVIIHYPGGKVGDLNLKIEGVPKFISGEKVVLFFNQKNNRFWGHNLGFGTFKVINYGGQRMLINSIFPNNPQVGQISLEEFERSVRQIKGQSMKVVQSMSYPMRSQELDGVRKPASIGSVLKNQEGHSLPVHEEGSGFSNLWLVSILAILGAAFRLTRRSSY
jgi:hypothetical protein